MLLRQQSAGLHGFNPLCWHQGCVVARLPVSLSTLFVQVGATLDLND